MISYELQILVENLNESFSLKDFLCIQFLSLFLNVKGLKRVLKVVNKVRLSICLLIMLFVWMVYLPLSFEQQNPLLIVTPSLVKEGPNPPSVVGTDFFVNVETRSVSSSSKLVNVTFTLTFNSTLLQGLNASEGGFMKGALLPYRNTTFTYSLLTDRIVISNSIKPPYPPASSPPYPEGQGVIAKIFFRIKYQGTSSAEDTSPLTLTDVSLKNDVGGSIAHESRNGVVKIFGLVHPEISVINPLSGNNNFQFISNTVFKDSRFNVTLIALDVAELLAWQVTLKYNTSQLVATTISIPTKDPAYVFNGRQNFPITLNKTDYVQLADTILSGATFNGTGKLGIVEFKIIESPLTGGSLSSSLSIDNVDTYILDSDNQEIDLTKTSGYYLYVWAESLPSLEVKPSIYTAVEHETFKVTVWLNNVNADKRLISVDFKLRYNTTILSPIQVSDGSFLAGFGFTFDYYFNVGNVEIRHYMNPPYTSFPDGSGPIATLTFQGIYQDSKDHNSTLELVKDDISLIHENGTRLPTAPPINGLYRILSFGSSILTINVSSDSVDVGSDVAVTGNLKPLRQNLNITIYNRLVGEEAWKTLGTAYTNSFSNYSFIWTTTAEGTYEIQAKWSGDPNTNPAESEVKTITIEAKPAQTDFLQYAIIGAGITIILAIALALYFLKIKKH